MASKHVVMDVGLLQDIESVLAIDIADPPGVIAPLYAEYMTGTRERADAIWAEEHHDWLRVPDIHAVQQLRGWNRARFGWITVERCWLREVVRVMDNQRVAGVPECDEMLPQWEHCDDYAELMARFKANGACGECEHCQLIRYATTCDEILGRTQDGE